MSPRKSTALQDSPRTKAKPNTTAIHLHPTGKKPSQRTAGLQSAKVIGVTAQWLSQPDKSTTARQPGAASRPAPTSNGPARQLYTGAELAPYSGRPGAMDAFAPPSRMFDTLRYRDGTIKEANP